MRSRPVNVERTFQRSLTLAVSVAALVLASAEEYWFPAALTPVFAVLSHVFVDRRHQLRLPVWGANVLGLIAFLAMAIEFTGNSLLGKLLSGAHLLVYITWVVLMLRKGIRQYWWLTALCILQLSVASVLTTEGAFGLSLVGMLLLMLWTLSVFTLHRGCVRVLQSSDLVDDGLNLEDSLNEEVVHESSLSIRNGLQVDSEEPWIGWRFRGIVGFAFVASLFVAAVTFLIFPRVWVAGSPFAEMAAQRNDAAVSQTGFTENVGLGEIGRIMQTDARVLQFEITKMNSTQRVSPDTFCRAMRMDEILFRGNALGIYEKGRWSTGRKQGRSIGDLATDRQFNPDPRASDLKIRINQDPPIGTFAFAPVPIQNITTPTPRRQIEQRQFSSSLTFDRRASQQRQATEQGMQFEAWYLAIKPEQNYHSPREIQPQVDSPREILDYFRRGLRFERMYRDYAYTRCMTHDHDTALPNLSRLAKQICTRDGDLVPPGECADRIFAYLNSSGRFQYSLTNTIQNPLIDPVEDFLINRRTGHCEYFASAGTLMLQAVGVPARIVNGYKGYEENSVSGRLEVKQKHAHAWLEAFLDNHWKTFDPTPAARDQAVSQTSQLSGWNDLTQTFSDLWRTFVESMTPRRQEALARPWIDSLKVRIKELREQGIWETLKAFWTDVVLHPEKWFSPTTGVVTFVVLLLLGLIIQRNPLAWMASRLSVILSRDSTQQRSVVRFYDNFREVCRKHGLPLPNNQTAQENANVVGQHFSAVLTTESDQALPHRIAAAFNEVRFGTSTLSTDDIASLRNDVTRLGELLRTLRS